MITKREKAIEWWNNLPFNLTNTKVSKHHYSMKYFKDKNYNDLTLSEIENIYSKEIN